MDTSEAACLDFHLLHYSLRGFSITHQQPPQTQRGSAAPAGTRRASPLHPGVSIPGERRAEPGEEQHQQRERRSACFWTSARHHPAETEAGGHLHRREDHREVPQDAPGAPSGDVDLQNQGACECLCLLWFKDTCACKTVEFPKLRGFIVCFLWTKKLFLVIEKSWERGK